MRPQRSLWLIPPGICLLSSGWMVSAAASADLSIEKARTAARLQRPTADIENNINQRRTAFVTADIVALRGGMPIRVNGKVVGAVGVAGLNKETDTETANTAASALSPSPKKPQHN
jgi:glc operon protein GlcG